MLISPKTGEGGVAIFGAHEQQVMLISPPALQAQKLPEQNFSSGVRHGREPLRETPWGPGCACWPGAPRDLHDPFSRRARVLTTRVADHLPPRAVA